ncbi:unnamed protein product [Moneuplotes crassus]|uniref:Uncharacterized protein n=1 Tax=Euplotes crassus TaxID=5936 RepID=A0AAD1Y3H7_EUPCR|nr:unnamed protein product [Moneuplotes crassus]
MRHKVSIYKNAIAVHSSEGNLVFAGYSECNLAKVDKSTGAIAEQLKIGTDTTVECDSLTFSNDNSNIYVAGKTSSIPQVFKVEYTDFGSATITSISMGLNSVYSVHSYINSGQDLLIITGSMTSPSQAYSLLSVKYETGIQQWSKKLECPSDCVLTGANEALIVNSLGQVVSYFLDTKPIMIVGSLEDGSHIGCYMPGFTQSGLEISSIAYSTSFSKVFLLLKYDSGVYKIEYDPAAGTFSNAYVSTTIIPGWILEIGGHTIIGSGVPSEEDAIAVSRLGSNGIYGINTGVAFTSTSDSFTFIVGYSYTSDSTTFVTSSPSSVTKSASDIDIKSLSGLEPYTEFAFESEVIFQGGEYTLETTAGSSGNIASFFACSISGATSVVLEIQAHSNGEPLPSWVSLGSDSISLDYTVPLSAGGQSFYFTGKSNVEGLIYLRNAKISVVASDQCETENCKTCISSICTVCNDGYTLTSENTCESTPESTRESTCESNCESTKNEESLITNSSLVASGFAGTLASTTVSGFVFESSSQNVWALLNQYQLFLIIPFLIVKLPSEFKRTLRALQFSLINMDFMNSKSLQGINTAIDQVDYENPYDEFTENEFESGSAFVNCFDIIMSLCGIVLLNLLCHFTIQLFCNPQSRGFCSKVYRFISYLFYFKFYLRFFLESFLFVCLVSISELFRIVEIESHLLSYCLNAGVFVFLVSFICLVFACYAFVKDPHKNAYVNELFEGFKLNKFAKMQNFIFLIRRSLVVLIIVSMRTTNVIPRLTVYACLQFASLCLTIYLRPHDRNYGNIVEIINEVWYFLIIVIIIYLQEKESALLAFLLNKSILTNTCMILCVSLGRLSYQVITYYSSKRKNLIKPLTEQVTIQTRKKMKRHKNLVENAVARPQIFTPRTNTPDTPNCTSKELSMRTDRKFMEGPFGRVNPLLATSNKRGVKKAQKSFKKAGSQFKPSEI